MPKSASKLKAQRIRMVSTFQPVAWLRGRFIDIPLTQELLEDAGVQSAEEWNDGPYPGVGEETRPIGTLRRPFRDRIRDRLRIFGWILSLLRR